MKPLKINGNAGMKIIEILFGMFLLCVSVVIAAKEYTFTRINEDACPKCEPQYLNLGTRNQKESGEETIDFVNNSRHSIEIDKIEPSCGCTCVQDYKTFLIPGEKTKIKIKWNLNGKREKFNEMITVCFRKHKESKPYYSVSNITAIVEPTIRTTRSEIAFDKEKDEITQLILSSKTPFKIVRAYCENKFLGISINHEEKKITISNSPGSVPSGLFFDSELFIETDLKEDPLIRIPVYFN